LIYINIIPTIKNAATQSTLGEARTTSGFPTFFVDNIVSNGLRG
jgi:hypothetical protein